MVSTGNVPSFETASAINGAAIHLLRGLRATDLASGLTAARLSALSVLVFGGPRTMGRLADAEGVAAPTMTRIVDGLVTLGLVCREPHPDSARMVQVTATPEGDRTMRSARDRRLTALQSAMAELSPTRQAAITAAADALQDLAAVVGRRA